WRPGEGALYTREHFEAVHASLSDHGLFCAWIPMFQVQQSEFQIILRTFLDVFGQAYLWRGDFSPNQTAYGLLAFRDPHETLKSPGPMQDDPQNPQLHES